MLSSFSTRELSSLAKRASPIAQTTLPLLLKAIAMAHLSRQCGDFLQLKQGQVDVMALWRPDTQSRLLIEGWLQGMGEAPSFVERQGQVVEQHLRVEGEWGQAALCGLHLLLDANDDTQVLTPVSSRDVRELRLG